MHSWIQLVWWGLKKSSQEFHFALMRPAWYLTLVMTKFLKVKENTILPFVMFITLRCVCHPEDTAHLALGHRQPHQHGVHQDIQAQCHHGV